MIDNKFSKKLHCFGAKCSECITNFEVPILSEFSYGEFIFSRDDGRGFAYLNAFDDRIFDEVKKIGASVRAEEIPAARLQAVVARVMDPSEGHYFVLDYVCPHCKSHDFVLDKSVVVETLKILLASFLGFRGLGANAQAQKIKEILES